MRKDQQAIVHEYEAALAQLRTRNAQLCAQLNELQHSNADLSNLLESAQIATVCVDRRLLIRSYTSALTTIFNLIPSDCGRPITQITHLLQDVDLARDVACVLEQRQPTERSVHVRSGKACYLMRVLPYRTADGEVDGALLSFVNVTPMAVAEEQQRTLVAELNHRVRNILQVVVGLCGQTLRRAQDLQGFEQAFMGRMQALARAYDLLSRDSWRNVPIADLLRAQLAPFATEGSRYEAHGDAVLLSANAALALGMVLYELATNAIKYGALSVPEGHVDVSWQLDRRDADSQLVLHWSESGGPKVVPPSRQGFGSELVQRQLRFELNGRASADYTEGGLQVTLEIPTAGAVLS